MKTLKIGQVANATGLAIETIRYYEREKLLDSPLRDRSGYRQYTDHEIRQLNFIKNAKLLGFSLKEIRELMDLRLDDEVDRREVRTITEAKIDHIEEKIRLLQQMKQTLGELLVACIHDQKTEQCPILAAMEVEHCDATHHN